MPIDVRRAGSAGQTVWWVNAALAQTCSPDEAADKLSDRFHGLGETSITGAAIIGAMRARGIDRLALAVVESGDPVGVPGPAPVTREAERTLQNCVWGLLGCVWLHTGLGPLRAAAGATVLRERTG